MLSEEESNGGMAIARYVMKSVTLASDTPANKLFVAFTGMIQMMLMLIVQLEFIIKFIIH